jgi:hypothetical protein
MFDTPNFLIGFLLGILVTCLLLVAHWWTYRK